LIIFSFLYLFLLVCFFTAHITYCFPLSPPYLSNFRHTGVGGSCLLWVTIPEGPRQLTNIRQTLWSLWGKISRVTEQLNLESSDVALHLQLLFHIRRVKYNLCQKKPQFLNANAWGVKIQATTRLFHVFSSTAFINIFSFLVWCLKNYAGDTAIHKSKILV